MSKRTLEILLAAAVLVILFLAGRRRECVQSEIQYNNLLNG